MSAPTAFELDIHRRLLAGDLTASAELAEHYLAPLVERLHGRATGVRDDDLIQDAAVDILLNYAERPERYDPARMALLNYLVMAATGDLRNTLAKERRRSAKIVPLEAVEQWYGGGNTIPEEGALDQRELQALLRRVEDVLPDPVDRRLAALLIDGERKTEPYAARLGIAHLPVVEQRALVKRHKDRLKKRLERLGVKLRGQA